jgi:hypothetical protein
MVQVTCEKTGIVFEAVTRHTKSHPEIMAWLNQAYKDGWYNQALAVIKTGREDGYTTIEQFLAALQEAEKQARLDRHEAIKVEIKREQAAKDARRERAVTNAFLRKYGYKWHKWEGDEEDVDLYGAPEVEWHLSSPDGRAVSVKEAMLELAYQGVKWAKEWLAKRGIAEEIPAIEKQREIEREAEKTRAEQESAQNAERAVYQREAAQALHAAGFEREEAQAITARWSQPHEPREGIVHLGLDSGLPDGRQVSIVLDDDLRYGVTISGEWHGIGEVLEMTDLPGPFRARLLDYAERTK